MSQPTVALVGAYERDNFGDLLFAYASENYLSDFNVILTAPLKGSADSLMKSPVADYRELFDTPGAVDAVWSVGGQLGGVGPRGPIKHYPTRRGLSSAGLESPYIPRMTQFRGTRDVPFIVNSTVISDLKQTLQGMRVTEALREADAISVRDRSSYAVMEAYGLPGIASPDVVHTINRIVPQGAKHDSVIIQFAPRYFEGENREKLINWIATSPYTANEKVILWAAGIAPGHDSLDVYNEVARQVRSINDDANIIVSEERHPLKIVEMISGAKLSISTSLHARIVSTAYGIPRTSLRRRKLTSYCDDWDYAMPTNFTVNSMDQSVQQALINDDRGLSRQATILAEQNIRRLVDQLHFMLLEDKSARLRRRMESLNRFSMELQAELAKQKAK